MTSNKVSVLNVQIDAVTMSQAVETIEGFFENSEPPKLIATANAEMVMLANEDKEFKKILDEATLVVPDGAGVVWAARHQGDNMPERVAGFDLVQELLKKSSQKQYKVFFLGAGRGVAEQAKLNAEKKYGAVNIVGIQDGYFKPEDEAGIIAKINELRPDLLLVALGVPRQEKWLKKNLNQLNIKVAIGVGGTFDVMAGNVKRAPLWMQTANLEWSYRLFLQPQRIFRMMAIPKFMLKVLLGKKD